MIFVFYNILVSVISIFIIESLKNKQNFIVVLDHPNDIRKIHTKPIPLLGGIILFLNLLFFFTYKLFNQIDLKIFLVLYLLNFKSHKKNIVNFFTPIYRTTFRTKFDCKKPNI